MKFSKTYRSNFFRDWLFNSILWVIFVFVLSIIPIVHIGITGNETGKTFWDIFWTPSQELYPSPIIGALPTGIEILTISVAIWFLIVLFLWIFTAISDKVILTNEFIQHYGQRVKLSDIEKIGIGEAGVSAITKIYPSAPQPHELPQAVLKSEVKFDLPRWLMSTDFFEKLKKLAPEINVSLPKPKPYLWSLAIFYFLIFIIIILSLVGGFLWLMWLIKLPFTHLGNFNFVDFFKTYPLIEKIAIGAGGIVAIVTLLVWGASLMSISDKYWRKEFFKILITVGLLHFIGWFLYYFGILK